MVGQNCFTVCLSMAMMWMSRYDLGEALYYTLSHLITNTVNCPPQNIFSSRVVNSVSHIQFLVIILNKAQNIG